MMLDTGPDATQPAEGTGREPGKLRFETNSGRFPADMRSDGTCGEQLMYGDLALFVSVQPRCSYSRSPNRSRGSPWGRMCRSLLYI